MSTLCSSDTIAHLLLTLLLDLLRLCSFLTCHPLYLTYLLLLTPHLLPILSFFSPLLLSTSILILLTLLISSPHPISPELPSNAFRAILGILKDRFDGEAAIGLARRSGPVVLVPIDDMGLCSQVTECLLGDGVLLWDFAAMAEFYKDGSLVCAVGESPGEHRQDSEQNEVLGGPEATNSAELEYKVVEDVPKAIVVTEEAELEYKVAEDVSKATSENSENPAMDSGISRFEVPRKTVADPPADNVVGYLSRSTSTTITTTKKEHLRSASVGGLQRDGSMRKEKEWKRTLACKLYEERITFKLCEEGAVADRGGEEMDLLWEAYEDDANKNASKPKEKKQGKIEEGEDGEKDDDRVEKMCCLQAFRLSAGKMNLGVGGPNLAKVSKVLKGIGLFQRVSRRSRKK